MKFIFFLIFSLYLFFIQSEPNTTFKKEKSLWIFFIIFFYIKSFIFPLIFFILYFFFFSKVDFIK
jgi:hypothetical protein